MNLNLLIAGSQLALFIVVKKIRTSGSSISRFTTKSGFTYPGLKLNHLLGIPTLLVVRAAYTVLVSLVGKKKHIHILCVASVSVSAAC